MHKTQPLMYLFSTLNCTKIRQGSSSYLRQHLQKLWLADLKINKVTWYNVNCSHVWCIPDTCIPINKKSLSNCTTGTAFVPGSVSHFLRAHGPRTHIHPTCTPKCQCLLRCTSTKCSPKVLVYLDVHKTIGPVFFLSSPVHLGVHI